MGMPLYIKVEVINILVTIVSNNVLVENLSIEVYIYIYTSKYT